MLFSFARYVSDSKFSLQVLGGLHQRHLAGSGGGGFASLCWFSTTVQLTVDATLAPPDHIMEQHEHDDHIAQQDLEKVEWRQIRSDPFPHRRAHIARFRRLPYMEQGLIGLRLWWMRIGMILVVCLRMDMLVRCSLVAAEAVLSRAQPQHRPRPIDRDLASAVLIARTLAVVHVSKERHKISEMLVRAHIHNFQN